MWELLDRIAIIAGLIGFFGTAYSAFMWLRHFRREKRLNQPIPIRLVSTGKWEPLHTLPFRPVRRIVTRAEVLGLLGMIPSRQERFDWTWLHNPEFMHHIEEVHSGERDSLEIPLSPDEYAQLDLSAHPGIHTS